MILPRILDYEDGRLKVTAEAFSIPEIKAILDKHDTEAEPYLMYIHLLTWPESPHINADEDEKKEIIIFDVTSTIGDFDIDDELLEPAVERLKGMYYSPLKLLAMEMDQELHRHRNYLKNTPVTGDNMKDRMGWLKEIDKISTSYLKVKEQADKELEVKLRGDHEMGEY